MKYILILSLSAFSFGALADDETRPCNGERAERLVALKELGKFSTSYIAVYGSVPETNIFTSTPKEFEAGVPQALKGYDIFARLNSVGYMCTLGIPNPNPKKIHSRIEMCDVDLTTLNTHCEISELKLEFKKQN